MNEHLKNMELEAFVGAGLCRTGTRTMVRHLLACPQCRTVASSHVSPFLWGRIPEEAAVAAPSPEANVAYEAALDRAFDTLFEHRHTVRERSGVRTALALYQQKGMVALEENPRLLRGLTAYRTLLELCQELRYEDPKRMVDAGLLAVHVADRLSLKRYGVQRIADWRCRALLELSNAYRVADRLDDAERALAEASEAFVAGTGDDLLEARLYDVRASLLADRRCFEAAGAAVDTVRSIYERRGDRHLAGRALVSKGIYVGYGGAAEEAVRLLQEALTCLDAERDPGLVYAAVHNQAAFLLSLGRLKEAQSLLWKYPASPEAMGGRMNLLKIRWLAAQIDASLGAFARAEQAYREVKAGFEEEGLYYKAALVSLELAMVWMSQARHEDARALVVEVLGVFTVLRIPREALGSLLLLDKAFEERKATRAMLQKAIERLKAMEDTSSPALPFASAAIAAA